MSQDLKATLLRFAGQHATLTYHRPFADLVGSIEGALMLSQLLFWHEEEGEWICVPDEEWIDLMGEAAVTRYRLRKAREAMVEQGYLDTEVRKDKNGAPTQHYRIDMDAFLATWREHVDAPAPAEDPTGEESGETDPADAPLDVLLNVPPESVTPQIATEAWNRFANRMREDGYDISRVRKVTDTRRSKVERHRTELWPVMQEVFDRIERSRHLRGENGWTVSFDWIWKSESNYTKVLEGVYEDNGGEHSPSRENRENASQSDGTYDVGYGAGE
jgi:hypothetical protein